MPRFLRQINDVDVPTAALLMSTILIQIMLIVTMFSEDAFNFALDLTSALTLIPFLLAAGYALKLALTRETYTDRPDGWSRELVRGSTRHGLHRVPAVRGGAEVPPRLTDHLRAGQASCS